MDLRYEKIRDTFKNKILYTRKSMFSFVKLYLIRKYKIDFNVRKLKEITYGEKIPSSNYEKEAAAIFDMYSNLLKSKDISMFCKKAKISNVELEYNSVSTSIINIWREHIDDVYVFMLMNFLLLCNGLPIINPYKQRYSEFIDSLNNKDVESLNNLILIILDDTETLDANYYDNCLQIDRDVLIEFIINNKTNICEVGKINHIYLFGSYASGLTRYDSDIDLLVFSKDDLTFEEKISGINYIKELIRDRFKRIVDIHETTREILAKDNERIDNRILIF
ncbi:MAG: nucleotidyltransferase domain-containing protein [Bacilli bacterium]|nr:nucleotidyltransferase domain-containing protein [Bacilli bacterium]